MKLNSESKIFQAVSIVSTLLLHNILWFVCSLPIVTIGSATAAMYRITFNLREGKATSISAFGAAFRENFKKATISWSVFLVFGFAAVFYLNSLMTFSDLLVRRVLLAVFLIVLIPVVIASIYIFPLLAYYDNTVLQTWKNAVTVGMLKLPQTIGIAVLQLSPFLSVFVWPEWFLRLGIIWILLAPSMIMYWNSSVFLKLFHSLQAE